MTVLPPAGPTQGPTPRAPLLVHVCDPTRPPIQDAVCLATASLEGSVMADFPEDRARLVASMIDGFIRIGGAMLGAVPIRGTVEVGAGADGRGSARVTVLVGD